MEVGDLVVLKSDGPEMTVVAVEGDRILCCWWTDEDQMTEAEFHEACVMRSPVR